jgi:two-component system OmpR family response regulator
MADPGEGEESVMRVLVVEDDAVLRDTLARGLQESGYAVDAVPDGETALEYLRSCAYEVAVLDWRMPGISGLEVLQRMRRGNMPTAVLLLTARDALADRITGLDQGADDYLVKPFDFAELLARVRALQRRPRTPQSPRLMVGNVTFDPATRELLVGTQRLSLTGTELGILETLMRRSPAVVKRQSIAMNVWEDDASALGSNTIDVHLARLRSKLAGAAVRIETVRGHGYRLVAG